MPIALDESEAIVLSPAHFLIEQPSFMSADNDLSHSKMPPMERWRLLSQMSQRFWDLWSTSYLQQLQRWSKWKDKQPPIKVGDVVLIRREITAPCRWPLARVIACHAGSDGLTRVCDLRTSTTTLRRPIVKMVKLLDAEGDTRLQDSIFLSDLYI